MSATRPPWADSAATPGPRRRGLLLDPRNGPAWDLPAPTHPPRWYVVATTPRSGSTLLCRALWATGRVGAPKEYLNPMQIRDWELRFGDRRTRLRLVPLRGPLLALVARRGWTASRRDRHLARVVRRRSSGGWFGLKLHHHHFSRWYGSDIHGLTAARWIRLRRRDTVAQAVSWERALQTGRWVASDRGHGLPPCYVRSRIRRRIRLLREGDQGWDRALVTAGIEPLPLVYEDLVRDLPGAVRRVLAWLGVPGAHTVPVPPPDLVPQADALTASWCARYRSGG